MSGPKVIRLVTREEAEAVCRQEIAAFAAAAEALLRAAGSGAEGKLGDELAQRRRRLEELFAAGRFLELQKEAPRQAAFLNLEAASAEEKARAVAQSERGRRRRLADAAASVARAFPSAATQMRELARRALTVPLAALDGEQQTLDQAWRALAPRPAEQAPTTALRELAARLGAGEESSFLEGWLASRSVAAKPRDLRLDAALAELEALGGEEAARAFAVRAAALLAEPEERQALVTDSLLLDLGAELRRRREEGALRHRLAEAGAKLAAAALATPQATSLAARLEAALATPLAATAEPLLAEVGQELDRALAELAAVARRRAVLEGLATLGYEVRENMATAWVEGGRIVVQKPGSPDYGVELGAPADASRFQVRLVGAESPAAPRSPQRDRDQETIWCRDFERLRQLVAQDGGETLIERALAAGEVPVKNFPLAAPAAEITRDREAPVPQRRTLPGS